MSAMDIIEQIKKLPPEDVQAVRTFLNQETDRATPVEYISREEVEKSVDEVFTRFDGLFRKLAQ